MNLLERIVFRVMVIGALMVGYHYFGIYYALGFVGYSVAEAMILL